MRSQAGIRSAQPSIPASAIRRDHLVRRLAEAAEGRVVLLIAPPGSGKSVLLAQWAAVGAERPTAWLTIEGADDDAVRYAQRLVDTMRTIDTTVGETALECIETTGLAAGDDFVAALVEDLSDLPESTIVVEDLHLLRNPLLLHELAQLINAAPDHVHFVLSSRSDPGLSLQRLRLLDQVTELRQDALALDDRETAELVRRVADIDLDDDQIAKLGARVEGWAAGVQLAALSLRSADDAAAFIDTFAGDDRAVADYLTDEILSRLPPEHHRFLLRTSVLDRLTAPLCNAVTGDSDGQRMLDLLDRQSMFLVPLDSRRGWFRYHALFRDLLRYTLAADDPDLETVLLHRAANWHLAEGDLDTAVTYLAQARRWDQITDLVLGHGRQLWERGEATTAVRWLESVPEAALSTRPAVRLAAAVLYVFIGRTAATHRIFNELEASTALTPGERLVVETFRSTLVQIDLAPATAIEAADRVLDEIHAAGRHHIPDVLGLGLPDNLEHLALNSKGRALFYDGNPVSARTYIGKSIDQSDLASPSLLLRALGSAALVEAWTGNLGLAESLGQRALGMVKDADLVAHPSTADGLLALAVVAYERGDLDQATHLLDEAASRSRMNRRHTLLAIHALYMARIALARDDPDKALEVLATEPGDPPIPRGIASSRDAVQARLLTARGDIAAARTILDNTELPETPEVRAAAIHVELAQGHVQRANALLSEWPDESEPRPAIERLVCAAMITDQSAAMEDGIRLMSQAVALGEPEGHMRVFVDSGGCAAALIRELSHRDPTHYLRELDEHVVAVTAKRHTTNGLVEQLSARELVVLSYLPSRYSNPEIAARLYVSTNTVKTHLKHIYRKLQVSGRSDAIEAARAHGLL
jgi:LuxR family maltose regulon positive regulatory protein